MQYEFILDICWPVYCHLKTTVLKYFEKPYKVFLIGVFPSVNAIQQPTPVLLCSLLSKCIYMETILYMLDLASHFDPIYCNRFWLQVFEAVIQRKCSILYKGLSKSLYIACTLYATFSSESLKFSNNVLSIRVEEFSLSNLNFEAHIHCLSTWPITR